MNLFLALALLVISAVLALPVLAATLLAKLLDGALATAWKWVRR